MCASILGTCLCVLLPLQLSAQAPARATLFPTGPERLTWYLPHLTWEDVEAYLRQSDMILIPVGSLEQHGKHLPLGTDFLQAQEICLRVGERCKVLVAPVVMSGVSDYHMGFAGTLTLAPETFQAVLFDTARSLVAHGFRRLLFYTGHGGNRPALTYVIDRINRETPATAIDLTAFEPPTDDPVVKALKLDLHAGVEETSIMLHLAPSLVRMERAENPTLTLAPNLAAIYNLKEGEARTALDLASAFLPESTGKRGSTREMSSNGAFTTGDIRTATPGIGKSRMDALVQAMVKAVETIRSIPAGPTELGNGQPLRPGNPGSRKELP